MNDDNFIRNRKLILVMSVFAGILLSCSFSSAQSHVLKDIKKTVRKPFIYDISAATFLCMRDHDYSSLNSNFELTGYEYGGQVTFSMQLRPFIRFNSKAGLSLGYSREELAQKEIFFYDLRKHDYIDASYITIRPALTAYILNFIVIGLEYDAKVLIGGHVTSNGIPIMGLNEDCLKRFASDIHLKLGAGGPDISAGLYLDWTLGSGLIDLDKLYYYDRARYEYTNYGPNTGFFVSLSIFKNGK